MRNERGTSAVEYALITAGVAAAMIFVVEMLGVTLGTEFKHQNDQISCCQPSSTPAP